MKIFITTLLALACVMFYLNNKAINGEETINYSISNESDFYNSQEDDLKEEDIEIEPLEIEAIEYENENSKQLEKKLEKHKEESITQSRPRRAPHTKINEDVQDIARSTSEELYICQGNYAYAYHNNKNCSGLNRCKAEIVGMTIEEAKHKRSKPCGKCY